MILQALVKYYEIMAAEGKLPKQGYCTGKVSYVLELSREGELCGITSLRLTVERGTKKLMWRKCWKFRSRKPVPSISSPSFSVTTPSTCWAWIPKGSRSALSNALKPPKTASGDFIRRRSPCRARHPRIFDYWDPATAAENPYIQEKLAGLTAGGNLIFRVDMGDYAQDIPALREAWEASCAAQEQSVELPCLVTGERQPIAILHGKIRGVKDAQSVGANLVSFNSSAYESYGRDHAQGLNAPVGKHAAFAYVTALNALLANPDHRLIISDTTVVFWAESANPAFQGLFNAAISPKEDNQKLLHAMLEKISQGLPPGDGINPETPFYILGLAPNAARLSVRFSYRIPLEIFLSISGSITVIWRL